MRRSNFRRRVWEPAIAEVGVKGFRFHDLRHTAAALRYQHVIDGQDADIVRYLERFGDEPPVPFVDRDDTASTATSGHAVGTNTAQTGEDADEIGPDQDLRGGDDGTRTHDPLLAKQVL